MKRNLVSLSSVIVLAFSSTAVSALDLNVSVGGSKGGANVGVSAGAGGQSAGVSAGISSGGQSGGGTVNIGGGSDTNDGGTAVAGSDPSSDTPSFLTNSATDNAIQIVGSAVWTRDNHLVGIVSEIESRNDDEVMVRVSVVDELGISHPHVIFKVVPAAFANSSLRLPQSKAQLVDQLS